jgi:hypothetical protein
MLKASWMKALILSGDRGTRLRLLTTTVGTFTSMGAWTVIENSEMEHSVILENRRIQNIERLDSVVGQGHTWWLTRTSLKQPSPLSATMPG